MKPMVTVVIPVFNQLEYTKKCLDSLLADEDRPSYEIIVVDNASTDGTRKYLEMKKQEVEKHASRFKDEFKPIFNERNLGVAPAWNQGAQAATTGCLAILNNDIVLTKGWLRSVLWAMENYQLHLASPFAGTGVLDYDLEKKAQCFTEMNIGKVWEFEYDFCAFVLKKKYYEKIGPFDENFKVGGYEDTDYCYRFKKEGLKYGVAGASYIHHFGSSTLLEFKKRGDEHAVVNKKYFMEKWGEDPSAGVGSTGAKLKRAFRRMKLRWGMM